MLIFVSLIGYLVYFDKVKSDDFINSPYNTRQDTFSDRVVRGKIESSDGEVLAQTNVYEDGTEERTYPYANIFSHVVGYDSNGKSGLESEANFLLLTSHEFFLNQMKNEFKSQKNMGDTVVSTLNADLQTTAYQALGDRRGAVVAIEPSTGKILVEVSKPDFDPSTIAQNWEALVNDQNDSSLLNRATNGAYPPGSVFKIVTALDYFRTRGTLEDFSYLCEGGITKEGHTIRCYGGEVHGQEDFYSAFAHSCNSAFAEIGTMLGGSSLRSTAEDLLFNKDLPLTSYRKSTFSLNGKSSVAEVMQTAIGQGKTLVSPYHMMLISATIANDGVLMTPYVIDHTQNKDGTLVKQFEAAEYGKLLSKEQAQTIREYMQEVVESGTASALKGQSYTAYGKTGSAEINSNRDSHAWFTGFATKADSGKPDIAIAVIAEEAGTGGKIAAPIAKQVFDAYYAQ